MRISLIHPSRQRPEIAGKVIKEWLSKAKKPENIEYILSIDIDDNLKRKYKEIAKLNKIKLIENRNRSAIMAINIGAKQSTGDLLIVVSDDFSAPDGWDELLLKELEGKSDFLVKTKDGIQKTLITLPIMDRVYYNRFGYIYEPGYLHMFCDQEMTSVGIMTNKVIFSDLEFEHRHYSVGKFKKDAINIKNDKTWNQGKKHFHERLKNNFGIKDIAVPYSEIQWK